MHQDWTPKGKVSEVTNEKASKNVSEENTKVGSERTENSPQKRVSKVTIEKVSDKNGPRKESF